jgi:hypothetical protein
MVESQDSKTEAKPETTETLPKTDLEVRPENESQAISTLPAESSPSPPDATPSENLPASKKSKGFFGRFKRNKKLKSEKPAKTELTDEELTDELFKRIASVRSSEYFIIKIRKRNVLVLLGIIIASFWILALWKYWQLDQIIGQFSPSPEKNLEEAFTNDENLFLRIRTPTDQLDQAELLQTYLQDNGYPAVDLVGDESLIMQGVSIVVKPGNESIRDQLQQILSAKYSLSSPSAELALDSDFDAVILFSPERPKETSSQ